MSVKKIIIFTILLLSISAVSLGAIFIPSLEKITMKGNTYYTEESLTPKLLSGFAAKNTIFAYLKLKYDKDISIPFIDEIDVDFTGLHSLTIGVYEKEVIGCLAYMGEYVCFDKDGVMVGSIVKKRDNIPLVEGINYREAVFNKPISADNAEIFAIVLNITQLINKYKLNIEQIEFAEDFSVKLYTGDIKILLGKRKHFDEQISNLSVLLPKLKGLKGTLHMEDYSSSDRRVIFDRE